jgi:hypothetical protein
MCPVPPKSKTYLFYSLSLSPSCKNIREPCSSPFSPRDSIRLISRALITTLTHRPRYRQFPRHSYRPLLTGTIFNLPLCIFVTLETSQESMSTSKYTIPLNAVHKTKARWKITVSKLQKNRKSAHPHQPSRCRCTRKCICPIPPKFKTYLFSSQPRLPPSSPSFLVIRPALPNRNDFPLTALHIRHTRDVPRICVSIEMFYTTKRCS